MNDKTWWCFTIEVAVEAPSREDANVALRDATKAVERVMPDEYTWTVTASSESEEADRA